MDVFCKIINKEIPSEILFENNKFIAINDINPITKGHFLVIPKTHSDNLFDIKEEDFLGLISISKEWALKRVEELNVSGFTLKINNGSNSEQIIFHSHIHIIPSEK